MEEESHVPTYLRAGYVSSWKVFGQFGVINGVCVWRMLVFLCKFLLMVPVWMMHGTISCIRIVNEYPWSLQLRMIGVSLIRSFPEISKVLLLNRMGFALEDCWWGFTPYNNSLPVLGIGEVKICTFQNGNERCNSNNMWVAFICAGERDVEKHVIFSGIWRFEMLQMHQREMV